MAAASTITSGLAERYATALFDLAKEDGQIDAVMQDLDSVRTMLDESEDLRRTIRSPVISASAQAQAITAVADRAGLSSLTKQFLGLLAHKRRLFALPQIIEAFRAIVAKDRGEISCEVISAAELQDNQIAALRESVSAQAGKDVNLSVRVEPELLGGVVVRIGSRMIDASLRTKLQNLEHSMRGIG